MSENSQIEIGTYVEANCPTIHLAIVLRREEIIAGPPRYRIKLINFLDVLDVPASAIVRIRPNPPLFRIGQRVIAAHPHLPEVVRGTVGTIIPANPTDYMYSLHRPENHSVITAMEKNIVSDCQQ